MSQPWDTYRQQYKSYQRVPEEGKISPFLSEHDCRGDPSWTRHLDGRLCLLHPPTSGLSRLSLMLRVSTLRRYWPPRGGNTAGGAGSEGWIRGQTAIAASRKFREEDRSFCDPIRGAANASALGGNVSVVERSAAEIAGRRFERKMRNARTHRWYRKGRVPSIIPAMMFSRARRSTRRTSACVV